ncbi:MAG: hypothetical protein ACN4E2_02875 [Nitrospinota bacterium]
MKCPFCNYVSFEYLNSCNKCSKDLSSHKIKYSLTEFIEPIPLGLASYVGASSSVAAGGEPFLDSDVGLDDFTIGDSDTSDEGSQFSVSSEPLDGSPDESAISAFDFEDSEDTNVALTDDPSEISFEDTGDDVAADKEEAPSEESILESTGVQFDELNESEVTFAESDFSVDLDEPQQEETPLASEESTTASKEIPPPPPVVTEEQAVPPAEEESVGLGEEIRHENEQAPPDLPDAVELNIEEEAADIELGLSSIDIGGDANDNQNLLAPDDGGQHDTPPAGIDHLKVADNDEAIELNIADDSDNIEAEQLEAAPSNVADPISSDEFADDEFADDEFADIEISLTDDDILEAVDSKGTSNKDQGGSQELEGSFDNLDTNLYLDDLDLSIGEDDLGIDFEKKD